MNLSAAARVRLEFAAKAFLLTAFAGTVTAGLFRIHARAVAAEQTQVDLGSWSVVSKPDWCTLDDVRGIREGTALRGWQTPLLHGASGPIVAAALESSPNVLRVVALRRVHPNAYDAVLEVRRPVAALGVPGKSGRWVEVDAEGVVVSGVLDARPVRDGRPLRVIAGATVRDTRQGAKLGRDVVDGAALCADLDAFASTADDGALLAIVDVIDVTNHAGRKKAGASEIALRASGQGLAAGSAAGTTPAGRGAAAAPRCVVEWGRAQGVAQALCDDLEPDFAAKAERLLRVLRAYPDLGGLDVVQVGFADLTVVPSPAKHARR